MEYALSTLPSRDVYRLLSSLVIPRPIAWVTTLSENGTVNAAPFSYFNVMGSAPALVVLGIADRPEGGLKDTAANLERTGECVIHLVSEAMAHQMNETAADLPHGESETAAADLEVVPSVVVTPPRLVGAPAALEGRLNQSVQIGENRVLMVEIVHVFVDDAFAGEGTKIRAEEMGLIGRVNGPDAYCRTGDRLFLSRPK